MGKDILHPLHRLLQQEKTHNLPPLGTVGRELGYDSIGHWIATHWGHYYCYRSIIKFKATSSEGRWSAHILFKITLNNNTFVYMYPHVKYFDYVLLHLRIFSSFLHP